MTGNPKILSLMSAAGIPIPEGYDPPPLPKIQPSGRGKRGPDLRPRHRRGQPRQEATPEPVREVAAEGSVYEHPPTKERIEIRRRVRAMGVAERRAAVPSMLRDLLYCYFDFPAQDFHVELLELMFGGGRFVVNWPTDHAKSTMTSLFFPILSLMENPNESHIICGANINDSKSWVQTIQRELETNRALIEDYPWLAKPGLDVKAAWSTTALTVSGRTINKRNPSVLAVGAGSNDIRGRRGKLVMDDIEGERHSWSPTNRQRLHSWVTKETKRCYEDKQDSKRPLLLLCGTPFDVDSIYFKMPPSWRVLRREVYTDPKPWRSACPWDHVQPHTEENHMLWPDKFDKVLEQWKDMAKADFAIAYLMDPKLGNPGRLSLEEIMRLTSEASDPEGATLTFVSLDAASGSDQMKADYAGLAVVRICWPASEKYPQVEVLDAYKMREGLFEQVHLAADLARFHKCDVMYEVDGLGSVYGNAFGHLAPDIKLLRSRTRDYRLDTDMGLTIVRTLVSAGRLKIPASKLEDEGMEAFRAEIRDLGGYGHDHISAAVWFVVRWLYRQVRVANGARIVNGWGAPPPVQRDYVDRDYAPAAASSGWGPSIQYRKWGR